MKCNEITALKPQVKKGKSVLIAANENVNKLI